jgi:predicted DNA-binding protein
MSKTKQIVMSEKLASRVETKAEELGLNESEYIRNEIARDLQGVSDAK